MIDVVALCASFVVFGGGAHGPIGPMVVMGANYPVFYLLHLPFDYIPGGISQELFAFAVVVGNGALYGLVVGFVITAFRRIRHSDV